MGKKNGPGTSLPHQRGFFAEMGMIAGYNSVFTGIADAGLIRISINAACSGTKAAFVQDTMGFLYFISQKPIFISVDIDGFNSGHDPTISFKSDVSSAQGVCLPDK